MAKTNPALRADIEAHGDLVGFFYALDLDAATHVLRRSYRRGGPLAWDPAVLLRILFLMFFERHLHFGAVLDRLRQSTLLRVLCGIDDDRVPGRSTVYDFLHRLPGFETEIRRERNRRIRRSRNKPKHKHRKGEKPPPRRSGIVKVLARHQAAGTLPKPSELVAFLNFLLDEGFVKPSRAHGLVAKDAPVAGDSTPFYLHASPFGKRTQECDCPPMTGQDCPHRRTFSAPRAAWAWDSSKGRWYYGYRFYELTQAAGPELPLYVEIAHRPSRHDSVLGYLALSAYAQSGHRANKVLLDSAHDNAPTYALVRTALGGIPFVDLNGHLPLDEQGLPKIVAEVGRNQTPIDAYGRPQCDTGAMAYRGRSGDYHRYDCPALRADSDHPCVRKPKGCYGATSHVRVAMDGRHICEVARGTDAWEKEYDRRTTVERSNNRKKNDLGLEARKNRLHPIVAALYVLAAAMQHAVEWAKAIDGQALVRSWLAPITAAA
ncbi:MAG: transposase [Clostridia bacterium]